MKIIPALIFLLAVNVAHAKLTLATKDINNLIAISKLYSANPNATGEGFARSVDSLRTPALNKLADVLIAINKGDTSLLQTRFLYRPTNDELTLWYIFRELHYNTQDNKKSARPDMAIVNEYLSADIDERWLLDNYYYHFHGAIATLFNDADLKDLNFDMDNLGLKNKMEKAIFFLNTLHAFTQRFQILEVMKNYKKLIEYANKLPTYNGNAYYYYKDFDYPDFDWYGTDKKESYNDRHIGNFYHALIAHFTAAVQVGEKTNARLIYHGSILSQPKYFKFSVMSKDLQTIYDKSK